MQIKIKEEQQFYIIQVFGDVDASSALILDKTIQQAYREQRRYLLVDCNSLNYISSAGLGVFTSYLQDFKENKTFFALFGMSPKVKNVFQILGIDQLLQITDTQEEAKALVANDAHL
jgi:anti-sigma B factor antagonist